MRFSKLVVATLLLATIALANKAAAEAIRVQGTVVDESGAAIAGAVVSMRNATQEVAANGAFEFDFDSPTTLLLKVEAPGYYPFLHTLHRSDFVAGRAARIPAIELVQQKAGRTLLLFAGDSMLSRRYFEPRANEPVLVRQATVLEDGKKMLQHIRPYIKLADIASVNLETQLSNEELTNRLPKSVTFYSPAELAELMEWTGFDYVALGNNHMYDYRDEGLTSTFAALGETALAYSGGGFDDAGARQPATVDIDGRDHAFLSYVGWAGTFSPTQSADEGKGGAALGSTGVIADDLGSLTGDPVSVVQLHAGLEYAAMPAMSEQTTLRQAIVDGADISIGHHPHVLQGFEIYDGQLIAYSLGNFLFDQYHYTTQLGMLLYVWMDGEELHRAEVVPMHVNGYLPTPATGALRYAVLTRLARLSDASVCMSASGFHAVVDACDSVDRAGNAVVAPSSGDAPVHVRSLGASPLLPVSVKAAERPYRLGIDLSRRGDFEYARLFGAHDRTWILGDDASLKTGDNNRLEVRVPKNGGKIRTGMKVFERVFTLSSPATFSGRINVSGNVRIRFMLQRRRMTESLEDALANGPLTEIGTWEGSTGDWTDFSFNYNQPRITTRSVRLLIDIENTGDDNRGATVSFDDLAWVEWQTPWLAPNDSGNPPAFATHLQLRSQP